MAGVSAATDLLAGGGVLGSTGTGRNPCDFALGGGEGSGYRSAVMTRSSIELAVQVFLVSLVFTFIWAAYKLLALLGWI